MEISLDAQEKRSYLGGSYLHYKSFNEEEPSEFALNLFPKEKRQSISKASKSPEETIREKLSSFSRNVSSNLCLGLVQKFRQSLIFVVRFVMETVSSD